MLALTELLLMPMKQRYWSGKFQLGMLLRYFYRSRSFEIQFVEVGTGVKGETEVVKKEILVCVMGRANKIKQYLRLLSI